MTLSPPSPSLPALLAAAPRSSSRYIMLDAFRGLAALGVVAGHVAGFPGAHICVMLFFGISGYCIAASAENSAANGLGFGRFMLRRLHRIYPPYLLAFAFFLGTRWLKALMSHAPMDGHPWYVWLQNATLTQWIGTVTTPGPAPWANAQNLLAVSWSLQYEEQFYFIMAILLLLAPLARRWSIGILAIISAIYIALTPQAFRCIFLDYWLHFSIGCLVYYRLCMVQTALWRRVIDLLLVALAAGAISWWVMSGAEIMSRPCEFTTITVFSLLLIALKPADTWLSRQIWMRPLLALGVISYSLYLVHQFNLVIMQKLAEKIIPASYNTLNILVQMAAHCVLAMIFWFFCERPFLNRRLGRARGAPPAAGDPASLAQAAAPAGPAPPT